MSQLPKATNESYEIKRIQMVATACCSPFMHSLGGVNTPVVTGTWNPDNFNHFLKSDRWRKDKQIIDFYYDKHDGRKSEYVLFTDAFYGPESDFVEGTPKLLQNVELNVDGLTKIFDNSKGLDPLHIAYSEAVTLTNSVAISVRNAFTFDVTTSSETTVSGSYTGASLEEKLSTEVHVGLERETTEDTEESKDAETAVAVEFDCPAGAIKQVNITKKHQKELIPVSGNFVVDFSMELKLRHWWNNKIPSGVKNYREQGQDTFKVSSVKGLYELMRGVDTNYPHLAGFWQNGNVCWPAARNAMIHLLHPENRTYSLEGDKMRVIESNEDFVILDLVTVDHGNGAVVDLSEEQNRERYTG